MRPFRDVSEASLPLRAPPKLASCTSIYIAGLDKYHLATSRLLFATQFRTVAEWYLTSFLLRWR